jgi:hypothetical protein
MRETWATAGTEPEASETRSVDSALVLAARTRLRAARNGKGKTRPLGESCRDLEFSNDVSNQNLASGECPALAWCREGCRGPFGFAQGRLFDSAAAALRFAAATLRKTLLLNASRKACGLTAQRAAQNPHPSAAKNAALGWGTLVGSFEPLYWATRPDSRGRLSLRDYGLTPPVWQSLQVTMVRSPRSTGCLNSPGGFVSTATLFSD